MTRQDHRPHRDLADTNDPPGPTGKLRRDVVFGTPPPAAERPPKPGQPDAIALDAEAIAEEPVGDNTIAEGRVTGTQGPPHASRGQGQGG
jgi:hypothetical protein